MSPSTSGRCWFPSSSKGLYLAVGAFIALTLQGCDQDYDVNMTYTCSNSVSNSATDSTPSCLEWKQSGKVKVPGGSCFSESAQVITATGAKKLSDVQLGDEILGYDQQSRSPVYTAVRAWLHVDRTAESTMTTISTAEAGELQVSANHPLAVDGGSRYVFASQLKAGDELLLSTNRTAVVKSTSAAQAKGMYAPLTMTSNYFVSGEKGEHAVLAHSFAHMQNPERYEVPIHMLFSTMEFFKPSVNDVPSTSEEGEAYVHPVAKALMQVGGSFLMSHSA